MADALPLDAAFLPLPPPRRALRIACVTETYPPEVNGVALTVARVVEGLRARGHAVQLVRPCQAGEAAGATDDGTLRLPGLPIPRYPDLRMGLPAVGRLVRQWRAARPDVVHIATEGPLGWSALRAARRLGLPTASDFRTNFHHYGAHYGLGALTRPITAYLRWFHNATRCTMVPTEALRRELAADGFRNLAVVGRGIDTAQFDPAHRSDALRAAWGVRDDALVLACVGRLAPEKNLDALLRAYDATRAVDPTARLLLVGDGPLRGALQARCPQAIFAGQQRGAALAAHYASADLFVFPSLTETYGNVVPEALASGLPVVAHDRAAAAELVVDGVHGRLVAGRSAADFAAAVRVLAADADACRRMGRAARSRVVGRRWEVVVAQVEGLLDGAVAQAERAAARAVQAGRGARPAGIRVAASSARSTPSPGASSPAAFPGPVPPPHRPGPAP